MKNKGKQKRGGLISNVLFEGIDTVSKTRKKKHKGFKTGEIKRILLRKDE